MSPMMGSLNICPWLALIRQTIQRIKAPRPTSMEMAHPTMGTKNRADMDHHQPDSQE